MRGFIDHIKQKYNHVDVKSPPRMSLVADDPAEIRKAAAADERAESGMGKWSTW